jgi:uncharacterized protein YdeI (BOF family)
MNNQRAITIAAVALLSVSWLTPCLMAADTEGVMMQHGKMMMMKDGKAAGPMEHSMTMSNGTTVMSDGTVKMKGGVETHMKDEQTMMMDGHMMEGGHGGMMESGHNGMMGGGSTEK